MYICIFSNLVFSFSVRISRNENITKTELVLTPKNLIAENCL